MDHLSNFDENLKISSLTHANLNSTIKWTKFISIVGMVLGCLMALIAIFAGAFIGTFMAQATAPMPAGGGFMVTLIYLFIAAVIFIPNLFLFQFSKSLKVALQEMDNDALDAGFGKLKLYFTINGVIMLIGVCFYALFFFILLLGGGFAMLNGLS